MVGAATEEWASFAWKGGDSIGHPQQQVPACLKPRIGTSIPGSTMCDLRVYAHGESRFKLVEAVTRRDNRESVQVAYKKNALYGHFGIKPIPRNRLVRCISVGNADREGQKC